MSDYTLAKIQDDAVADWLGSVAQAPFVGDILSSLDDLRRYEQRKAVVLLRLAQAAAGESVPSWQRALKLFKQVQQGGKDADKAQGELLSVLQDGASVQELEAKFDDLTARAHGIRKDENKRLMDLEERITKRELKTALDGLSDIVVKTIHETGRILGIEDDQLKRLREAMFAETVRFVRSSGCAEVD
jgi:hypothetical protein